MTKRSITRISINSTRGKTMITVRKKVTKKRVLPTLSKEQGVEYLLGKLEKGKGREGESAQGSGRI